ncbi:hypothetical protein [Mycolicibacter engbaekii]|uniref:hypothetical protein n=1 Tax=Mycolicibacter engbaekii TaxID=188915 RepID=UPI001056C95B|nr:hypothetical protein [Mycolicibacter engbaekii]
MTDSYAGTNPGMWVLIVGLVAVASGCAFLWTGWRTPAALTAAIGGGISFLLCLMQAMDLTSVANPHGGRAHLSIGMGLLFACALTLVLVAVAVTAFVLERSSIGSRSDS